MKKIFAIIAVAAAALFVLSSCTGPLSINIPDYRYKVGEKFSFHTGIEVRNDYDRIIDHADYTKWKFVITGDKEPEYSVSGSFVTFSAPFEGTVQAIYDPITETNPNGKDIHSNTSRIRITE